MSSDGPARTAANETWCIIATTTTATTTTTSTVPIRPPTCSDGPARAVADEMWCTTFTTRIFGGVPRSLSAENRYVRMMYFWKIASGV